MWHNVVVVAVAAMVLLVLWLGWKWTEGMHNMKGDK